MGRTFVIVGGGVSGLTAAFRLEQKYRNQNINIILLEKSDRLGGVLYSEQRGPYLFEHGPDCFISDKVAGMNLAKDLGVQDQLVGTRPEFRRSYIYHDKLIEVPEGLYLLAPSAFWPFITTPLLSLKGKIRAGLDYFIPRNTSGADESLASFVRRRLGNEMLENVAQPMVAGIYTADPNELSLQSTMPQFLEMEKKYGSVIKGLRARKSSAASQARGPRYSLFVSFKEGIGSWTTALERSLNKTEIKLNKTVVAVERDHQNWKITLADHTFIEADDLIMALSANKTATLLTHSQQLYRHLKAIPHASTAIVTLVFKRDQIKTDFRGIGFVIPATRVKTITACSFLSHKFLYRSPSDESVVLRCFVGGKMHEKTLQQSDEQIIENVYADLDRIVGLAGQAIDTTIKRWDQTMPQYVVGHQEKVNRIDEQSRQQGLTLIGHSYKGVGIPDVIGLATHAVESL